MKQKNRKMMLWFRNKKISFFYYAYLYKGTQCFDSKVYNLQFTFITTSKVTHKFSDRLVRGNADKD